MLAGNRTRDLRMLNRCSKFKNKNISPCFSSYVNTFITHLWESMTFITPPWESSTIILFTIITHPLWVHPPWVWRWSSDCSRSLGLREGRWHAGLPGERRTLCDLTNCKTRWYSWNIDIEYWYIYCTIIIPFIFLSVSIFCLCIILLPHL